MNKCDTILELEGRVTSLQRELDIEFNNGKRRVEVLQCQIGQFQEQGRLSQKTVAVASAVEAAKTGSSESAATQDEQGQISDDWSAVRSQFISLKNNDINEKV